MRCNYLCGHGSRHEIFTTQWHELIDWTIASRKSSWSLSMINTEKEGCNQLETTCRASGALFASCFTIIKGCDRCDLLNSSSEWSQTPCTLLCLLRTRANKEIDGKHRCRWEKGTRERGELDFVGFHKSIGLTFEGSRENMRVDVIGTKKIFSIEILFLNATNFSGNPLQLPKGHFKGTICPELGCLESAFQFNVIWKHFTIG